MVDSTVAGNLQTRFDSIITGTVNAMIPDDEWRVAKERKDEMNAPYEDKPGVPGVSALSAQGPATAPQKAEGKNAEPSSPPPSNKKEGGASKRGKKKRTKKRKSKMLKRKSKKHLKKAKKGAKTGKKVRFNVPSKKSKKKKTRKKR